MVSSLEDRLDELEFNLYQYASTDCIERNMKKIEELRRKLNESN